MHHHGHEQRIDHRDAGGLGRREDAAVDAAEDHHDGADRPARLLGRGPDRLPARRRGQRHHLDAGVDQHVDGIDKSDQQARQDAGGEQRDRRLLRRQRIEDHRDRRRDDDRDGARRRDQPDREALVVAVLPQRRIDHPADRHDGADRGVRHRAEQLRGRDRRHAERAAHAADQRDHPDHDPARDAALRHDLAGQHEERHRQQREIVEAAEQIGLDRLGRHVGDEQHGDEAGHQQHQKDRQPEHEQDRGQHEIDEDR